MRVNHVVRHEIEVSGFQGLQSSDIACPGRWWRMMERSRRENTQMIGVAVIGAGHWGPDLIRNFHNGRSLLKAS
jgi:hypothetical protein